MTVERRAPVAIVVSRFPLITETFILREIIELERQGQPIRLVPLLRETPPVVHREAEPWIGKALYSPFLSITILAANARAFRRGPRRYLSLLARVFFRSLPSSNLFFGALGVFPKSVYLAERLAAEGVGHVHAHFATHPATAAYIIHYLSGISWSFTAHAHDIFVHQAMLEEKIRAASFVRAISDFNRAFLHDRYPSAAEGRIHMVRVGIDPGPPPSASPAKSAEKPHFLSVAALKPYKGISVLIDACAILKREGLRFLCDVVGEGPERQRLERQIRDRALEGFVRLVGAEPQHRVAERMRARDVFVLASVVAPDGQMEGIPVALMEAMSLEKPVVASSLSGIPELVENEVSGLLVAPGDAEAVARALLRLVEDPALARDLGRRARERVLSKFRLDASVSRLLERIDAVREEGPASSWPRSLVPPRAGVRAIHEGRDAKVVEMLLTDGAQPQDVVVKIHRSRPGESAPPRERARREFEMLRRLASSLSVPRPLGIDESAGALVMEACQGTRLDELLRRARTSPFPRRHREAESALRAAGRWLREFQSETQTAEPGTRRIGELVERALANLERLPGAVRTRGGNAAFHRKLEVCAARERHLDLTGHHGDFWPGNVFVGDDGVRVIDFEGYGLGLPLEDAAWFTLHLEIFCAYPFLRRVRERCSRAFLAGYLEGRPLDKELFALCRAAKAVEMFPRASASGSSLLRPWRLEVLSAAFWP